MKQSEIDKRVKKLADHANGSLGRIPLERVFERHISFLAELRQYGATWGQIAQLLFTHGVTQKSGNILHANQVRVAFNRAQEKSTRTKTTPLAPSKSTNSSKAGTRYEKVGALTFEQPYSNEASSFLENPSESNITLNRGSSEPTETTIYSSDIRRRMVQSLKVRK